MFGTHRSPDAADRIEFNPACAARQRGIRAWLPTLVVVVWAELVVARFGLGKLQEVVDLMAQTLPATIIGEAPPVPLRRPERPLRGRGRYGETAGGI
jgi:hypothetical protein